jgi:hypothetical protein
MVEGDLDEAVRCYELALEVNARMGARPWVVWNCAVVRRASCPMAPDPGATMNRYVAEPR